MHFDYDLTQSLLATLFHTLTIGFSLLMLLDFVDGLDSLITDIPELPIPKTEFLNDSDSLIADIPKTELPKTEFQDPWEQEIEWKEQLSHAIMRQLHAEPTILALPPAPTTTDIERLGWTNIKLLAKGRVQGWNRLKKPELIQAIVVEAQITWRDLADLGA